MIGKTYRAKFEPLGNGNYKHNIPNEAERVTQLTPGQPYLIEEEGNLETKDYKLVELIQVIARSHPENWIGVEVEGDSGNFRIESGLIERSN